MSELARGKRKQVIGLVISNKMDKSCVVQIEELRSHKLYKKVMKRQRNFMVHDEENATTIGDKVAIMETRPLSKRKSWRLVSVIEKATKRSTERVQRKKA